MSKRRMRGREQRRRRRREQANLESVRGDPAPGWMVVGDRRMFVVGFTEGGAPYGCYEDEFEERGVGWLAFVGDRDAQPHHGPAAG